MYTILRMIIKSQRDGLKMSLASFAMFLNFSLTKSENQGIMRKPWLIYLEIENLLFSALWLELLEVLSKS